MNNIFQPVYSAGEIIASQIASAVRGKADAPRMKLARRAFEASLAFPNDTCGYVRRVKPEKPIVNPTPAEAFARLQVAFLAGPLPTSTGHRKATRGRSKRRRVLGVRIWGKNYSFNGIRTTAAAA